MHLPSQLTFVGILDMEAVNISADVRSIDNDSMSFDHAMVVALDFHFIFFEISTILLS